MAPSVIYIDEVEKVFVSDKKKSKEFGGQVNTQTRIHKQGAAAGCVGGAATEAAVVTIIVIGMMQLTAALFLGGRVLAALNVVLLASQTCLQEPFSRIRKDLLREIKALKAGDR